MGPAIWRPKPIASLPLSANDALADDLRKRIEIMRLTDGFEVFMRELRSPEQRDHIIDRAIPDTPWLLQINIDPKDAILEVRRYIGDPNGTCFRWDYCLSARMDDHGKLMLDAANFALEDLAWFPIFTDYEARRRAQEVPLPFAFSSLHDVSVKQEGHEIHLQLTVRDATSECSDARSLVFCLGTETCALKGSKP